MLGVLVMEGVSVIVGVRLMVGVRVIVGVSVMVGVMLGVGEGEMKLYTSGSEYLKITKAAGMSRSPNSNNRQQRINPLWRLAKKGIFRLFITPLVPNIKNSMAATTARKVAVRTVEWISTFIIERIVLDFPTL